MDLGAPALCRDGEETTRRSYHRRSPKARPVDWSNEPWRKLFTRDTASWCLLCWEARALLPQLFRKCDPSGRIDYPARVGAARAVAKLVDFPADVTSVGLTDLEQSGTVEIGARSLLLINFHAAQTAPTSTAERQRRRRERAKMDGAPVDDSEECKPANTGVTGGHAASRSVTKRREEKREKRRDDATPRARTRSKENAKPSVQLPVLADVRAASSGLLHELDMVRREVAAEFRVDLTGFSRNADQTLGGDCGRTRRARRGRRGHAGPRPLHRHALREG